MPKASKGREKLLRDFAMAYPEATEEFPWGERAIKVRGKVFVFLYDSEEALSITTKLPSSSGAALMFAFAKPTGYGLGKSGWVTSRFGPKEKPPMGLLQEWIDESYRAVAPKKLVAKLKD